MDMMMEIEREDGRKPIIYDTTPDNRKGAASVHFNNGTQQNWVTKVITPGIITFITPDNRVIETEEELESMDISHIYIYFTHTI